MGNANKCSGFGVVEVLIATAVISMTIFSLFYVFTLAERLSVGAGDRIKANFLAEEGLEALRFLRDAGWKGNLSNLVAGTNYYLSFDTSLSRWSVGVSNPGSIDNLFTRRITVENVSRNSNDDIVGSGGTNDPNTKKFNVIVSWPASSSATSSFTLSAYLSDIYNN